MSAHSTCPRPGCGAPESVSHLFWECSAAVDLWATAGHLQFPDLPARGVLNEQFVLYGVSQLRFTKEEFERYWLTVAAIKDAIWTSRNLLVRRYRQTPPVAVLQMAAAFIKAARGRPRHSHKEESSVPHPEEGTGASRSSHQRYILLDLDRAIFYFLWGSKWERLRREVVKKTKEKGGKGVPDFQIFLGSRYTSLHLRSALGPSSIPKCQAMARFWMGSYLRKLKLIPVDNRSPVSFKLPPAYAFIKNFLQFFKLEHEGCQVLKNHRALISAVQERNTVSPVRGLALGESTTVWRNVNHPALPNRLRDLSWLAAHEVLPVRTVMHSRGMSAHSTCPRPGCGAPESVSHLFWECSAAVDLWATAGHLQFPDLPARGVLNEQFVLYGVSQLRFTKEEFERYWLTVAAIKDAIWTSRNLLVRRYRQTPPVAVLQMAAAFIKAARGRPRHSHKEESSVPHPEEGTGASR
ncbi:uncharacterized protein LOC133504940 [Syngnathoides biaculeatus]|uniref:uncharacterized protein LOC133504940 n=1 Tax=Syngnathoides biaculeatus TaxID=300417 RepID=UPI002ADDE5C0|nr:uncharacterized protein LOC133504940 [Syngnathoides biaculeatus]